MHRCHLRRFEQLGSLRVSVSERHAVTTSVRIGIDFGLSVLTVALAACSGSVAPGLPTIVFTDPAPPSILEVPAAQMPEALKQFYVLKPDRRFLGAVAELHRLLSGDAADTVRVSRQGDRWVIAYAAERVGDLPDLPGFAEGSALLHSWAKRLLERYPLDTAGAPTGQERDTVAALLARLDASQLGAALRVVDAGWRRNRHAAWLPLAASGLVLLATQLPKVDVVGDPLVARALASVALAGAAGQAGDAVAGARALLAEHMGYTRDAGRLAAGLPPGDPVRLHVTRDRAGLRVAATRAGSTPLTRYLYVRAIADLGDSHAFREALDEVGMRTPSSGTLASAERSAAFVGTFGHPPPGLWTDAVRWCSGRAAVAAGRGSVDSLLDGLRTVRGLSEPALRRSLDDIGELLRYMDERQFAAARAAFARLDSRPHALRRASQVATDRLGDVSLAERLDQRLLVLAGEDYAELAVWDAQYRGDARTLAAQARDRSLTLDARFDALGYLLGIRADTPATFAAFERLLAEDPDNWDERGRYVSMLERARRIPDAARVARAWLATHGPERGFDHIFATIALARQYERMGRLKDAYALLEPLQTSYQLGVLQRSALIALASGRVDLADDLAQRAVDRYPGSPDARATLAEVRWAQRRYEAVAAVLNDPQHPLPPPDWRHTVGPAFARVFGRRPSAEGERAFDALAGGGVPATLLAAIPAAAADSGFFPLALPLKQRLLPSVGGEDGAAVEFYRYVVAARGAGAGRAWLAARWSPLEARRQALSIYRNGLYDLLWDLDVVPDDGAEGSYYWLVRALAWLQDPRRNPARGAQLMAFYRRPDARFYHRAGRFLLGMEPKEALLALRSTPHRRAEDRKSVV